MTQPLSASLPAFQEQLEAANVNRSVWVDASAGTGKTKVLTDRVLRLLLPRHDGQPATPPDRLLCVTFTNAGAAEMIERVQETSRDWLQLTDTALHETLQNLFGHPPTAAQIQAARRLFAQVVDAPGGLKIMTLHAFGQSILRRFPVEAGISPGFTLGTASEAQALRAQARNDVFADTLAHPDSESYAIVRRLTGMENESRLLELLAATQKERDWVKDFFSKYPERVMQEQAYVDALNLPPLPSPEQLQHFWNEVPKQRDALRQIRDALKTVDGPRAAGLHDKFNVFLALPDNDMALYKDAYSALFLNQNGTPNGNHPKDVARSKNDAASATYQFLLENLVQQIAQEKLVQLVQATLDLFALGHAIESRYAALKTIRNLLDFDDQILATKHLLQSRAAWVLYKLDQGIDHILLDEAQDTNPDQWMIIDAVIDEFFAGQGARDDVKRTLFAVGDEKQSIFGFQRADPDLFGIKQNIYASKVRALAPDDWRKIGLHRSFRSGPAVLSMVDAVMNLPNVRTGLITDPAPISHVAHRSGAGGQVILHPLCEDAADETVLADWPILTDRQQAQTAHALLVERITADICAMIGKRDLPSRGRKVKMGDILILLRKRSPYQKMLVRALRRAGLEVSGLDKMYLSDNMPVQDLLQLALGCLQPHDDLRLAGILKSPFIRATETDLFDLCYERNDASLYQRLEAPRFKPWRDWLQSLTDEATYGSPYRFFTKVLTTPCPMAQSGMRALLQGLGRDSREVIESFLNLALERQDQQPDLLSFCRDVMENPPEIKRQLAPGRDDAITIMTAHGSKGLQAPIVILPDTVSLKDMAYASDNLLWPRDTGLAVPIWGSADGKPSLYNIAAENNKIRNNAEYRRLLYVAMTRAEDELHVYGAKTATKISPECWYSWCEQGLLQLEQQLASGEINDPMLKVTRDDNGAICLTRPQTDKPADRLRDAHRRKAPDDFKMQDGITASAAAQAFTTEMVRPSQLGSFEPSVVSPLSAAQGFRFERGLLTHTLLQFLPDIALPGRNYAMQTYLDANAGHLPAEMRQSIADEVNAILAEPAYMQLFGPEARAEVPISGELEDGTLVSGQIDRLVVLPDRILLLDYKTNRPPPAHEKDVPSSYRRQLQTYKTLLGRIYPNRPITSYLLWTDGARLMEISDS